MNFACILQMQSYDEYGAQGRYMAMHLTGRQYQYVAVLHFLSLEVDLNCCRAGSKKYDDIPQIRK